MIEEVDWMDITAAVTHSQGKAFELEPVQLADPEFDEIRVRIVAAGVCHTDVVARDLGIAPFPIVLGHEGSGVVDAVGAGVSDLQAGDHVVLSFAHCGNCGHCLTGHPTVCDTFNDLNFGG
ncbi:MAG: alcohol dehydrogenase catalytic domain-containing protein, partial [Porticoccaceae bacterium]